ncbi:MAG: ABC transporter ATP-binding protein [Armatimonadota bacterium]|nr:ABC transporter ATP-binding protein [Armatimonadota bacterium]MDW8026131.1 ABC transporter ATP-binding protein [Armatimonadota bacterium]
MLEVKGLRKEFGQLVAVKDLYFTLKPGDIFGYIGPNGAGKTTTLRMLATLLEPTSGTAILSGIDIVRQPEDARPLIGFMPDFFGLYEGITVWEYLAFFADAYGIPRSERSQVIENVLELADLTVKRDAYVETLSRGMQQRLCLAKTLLHDPLLLLLDEPASGLDPRARAELKELFKEIGAMGKIVIISSHILPELSDFCNKIGIIEKGELLLWGDVDNILRQLQPTKLLTIRCIENAETLAEWLSKQPEVINVQIADSIVKAQFIGNDEAQADLLRRIILDGHKIAAFNEAKMNLEDVFLKVTKGEVA